MRHPSFRVGSDQRGAVLIISLLLLLVMTVLALGASQATRMQERMAGNARDHDLAFQSAEAGLRAAERKIQSVFTLAPPIPCLTGKCEVFELGAPDKMDLTTPVIYRNQNWWNTNTFNYDTGPSDLIGANLMARRDPQFLIEEFEEVPDALSIPPTGPPPARMYYRVTSRGVGGTQTTEVLLQSTFVIPL